MIYILKFNKKDITLADIGYVIQNVKIPKAFTDINTMLANIAENLEKICKNSNENLLNLKEQRDKIEVDIKKTREIMNKHLDKIQEELIRNLTIKTEREEMRIEDFLRSLGEKKKELDHFRADIEKIKQHASELQTFLAMKAMQFDVISTDKFIKSIVESHFEQTVVSCDIDSILLTFSSQVSKFGEIRIQKKPCKMSLKNIKEQEFQINIAEMFSQPIDQLTFHLEKTLNTKCGCVTGCTILKDGTVVVSNDMACKGKIRVLHRNSSVDFDIKAKFQTFDITKVKEDNVAAVTSRNQNKIHIIDIKEKKVIKAFKVEQNNYGITVRDDALLYCVAGHGIQQLNLNNSTIVDIVTLNLSYNSYIATF